MDKINTLKPGAGIELEAEIKNIQPIRYLLKCFNCSFYKMIPEEEYKGECPGCQAKESKQTGKGLWLKSKCQSVQIADDSGTTYLDLWNDDIGKFEVGNKIHLINGFARANQSGGVNVSKGKYGQLRNEIN